MEKYSEEIIKMKSKIEEKLDKEFEKFGVKPQIYYFVEDVFPFSGIVIVTKKADLSWKELKKKLDDGIGGFFLSHSLFSNALEKQPATHLIYYLNNKKIYGIAICNKYDQFNHKLGRIIAKGRLLQHLKKND